MNRKTYLFAVMLTALLQCASAFAQMTFTFSGGATAKTSTQADGTVIYTLPSNVSLKIGECITGVKVSGSDVAASAVTPNPTTTLITEGEIETFVYDGKAYSFRFMYDEWFTVVMFSDVHVGQEGSHDGNSKEQFTNYVNDIINMGKTGGKTFTFDNAPDGFIPTADLVLCLGDMDGDSQKNAYNSGKNDYYEVTKAFNAAGIPFVDIAGNHDLVPDYWGSGTEKALTWGLNDGGSYCNDVALNIVTQHINQAKTHGISDVVRFSDGTNHTQAQPYTFLFNGVRFYMGQTYWFQKPYSKPSAISGATYYPADEVVAALDAFVEQHKSDPSIWAQHYPFAYGSDCDRWWLDQNEGGNNINPSGTTSYPYTDGAAKRKNAIADIIKKTTNHAHFSGHVHNTATNTYNGVTDYSVGAPGREAGTAFIVLCKKNEGFKEVKTVTFNR